MIETFLFHILFYFILKEKLEFYIRDDPRQVNMVWIFSYGDVSHLKPQPYKDQKDDWTC